MDGLKFSESESGGNENLYNFVGVFGGQKVSISICKRDYILPEPMFGDGKVNRSLVLDQYFSDQNVKMNGGNMFS